MSNIKWDKRFLKLAAHIAQWSKDPSTKVGAVLVSTDRSQVVHGYNGFPRGVKDHEEIYADREEKYKRIVHAELNAILNCQARPEGWTLYVTPLPPCNECCKAIVQSGITRVVVKTDGIKMMQDRWVEQWQDSKSILEEAGMLVEYKDG